MNSEEGTDGQAYIRYLLSNLRCPVCHSRYTPDNILDLGRKNDLWFMALSCPECETNGLVVVILHAEPGSEELPTELVPEEFSWFEGRGVITGDDVLDFHEFLRDYRGDMAELLGDEP